MANIALTNDQYDDAVSRSYYAVFHAISALLFTKGLSFSSHSQTIGAFNKEFVRTDIFPKYYSKKFKLSSMKDKQEIMIFVRTLMR